MPQCGEGGQCGEDLIHSTGLQKSSSFLTIDEPRPPSEARFSSTRARREFPAPHEPPENSRRRGPPPDPAEHQQHRPRDIQPCNLVAPVRHEKLREPQNEE